MSKPEKAFPGDRHVHKGVEYFAGQVSTGSCNGCAFNKPDAGCGYAPLGCAEHKTIWLTKQKYITHRLTT